MQTITNAVVLSQLMLETTRFGVGSPSFDRHLAIVGRRLTPSFLLFS